MLADVADRSSAIAPDERDPRAADRGVMATDGEHSSAVGPGERLATQGIAGL
jgi:hypothetical protein